jgi:hypothetical protein
MNEELTKEQKEGVEEQNKEIKDLLNQDFVSQAIAGNEFEFEVLGKTYKVVKPTTIQRQEAYQMKVRQYMKLMKEKDEQGNFLFSTEKQLRKQYKDRGIDISDIETKIVSLQNEKNSYQEKLGKALVDKASDKDLQILKTEIEKINSEIVDLSSEKNSLLEYSLENQSVGYFYEYLTFCMTHIKNEKGEYERAWKTLEDFRKEDITITNMVGVYAGMILGSSF